MANDEILIRGGDVVDGTGAPARRADVRVRGEEIVEVGVDLPVDGATEIDASGAVITPGFIDTHCHTDPQVFWDPYVDPDLLHGVTTMLVGNCSLSLYPVTDATRGEVSDLFAYIEDVPRHLFDDAVPWTWSDYAGYRDVVNATGTGINLAGLVGHSMLRLVVMGADAWTRAATDEESGAMAAILREAMAEGAWGLSTSFLDVDQSGRPVPSRQAEGAEFDALFDVLHEARRGVVEVVPDLLGPTAMDTLRDLGQRCGERGVPITWTGFTYVDSAPHRTQRWIDVATELAEQGTQMYPQLSPRTVDMRLNWDSSMMFMSMPQGWHKVVAAHGADKQALLENPEWRAAARDEWDRTQLAMFPVNRLDVVRIVEVVGAENERWLGRTVADVVEERGGHPSDVLADFVLENDCRPGLVATGMANADVDGVAETLKNPAVLISSSDSGAHAQMMCSSGDTTLLLTRHVRERGDFTLEDAIYQLTGRQAEVFGFHRRGVVAPGNVADLNVFALDELTYGGDEFVHDLPQGGVRMRRPTGGYRTTLLGGTVVQEAGERTGALPGRVISSIG
jgi:N-acyl-D-aspartate/D-glutamate deacylase